jgi:hypothetical protein
MNNVQYFTVENMFQIMLNESRLLRQNNRSADGKEFWQPYKHLFKSIETKSEWELTCSDSEKLSHDQQEVMKLEEYITLGNGDVQIREMNHFKIQTVRLPLNDSASFVKIMQLALNIGQYIGSGGHVTHWMSIDKYISRENIDKINIELNGGTYDEQLYKFLLLVDS